MNPASSLVTGLVALVGVLVGGLITVKNQEKMWKREHGRQWRDIRLRVFEEFITAYRAMIAYIVSPDAELTVLDHPRRPGEHIPIFSAGGHEVREQLESAMSRMRLVAASDATAQLAHFMVFALRDLAAARARSSHDALPDELFARIFAVQQDFLTAARAELSLSEIEDHGRGEYEKMIVRT